MVSTPSMKLHFDESLPSHPPYRSRSDAETDKNLRAEAERVTRLKTSATKRTLDDIEPKTGLEYLHLLFKCIEADDDCVEIGHSGPKVTSVLFSDALQFLRTFDPVQVRYAGHAFRMVLEFVIYSSLEESTHVTENVFSTISTALLRLDPSGGTLTSHHLPFLHLCLHQMQLLQALPIIDKEIHSFPAEAGTSSAGSYLCSNHTDSSSYISLSSGLTTRINDQDVQEYYLLVAMVYLGLRRWEDALLYLEMVLISPTQHVATGLMLEAYKKWLLVSCIVYGKARDPPKNMNSNALRVLKQASRPYEALSNLFTIGDPQRLLAEINVGLELWNNEGNLGLALNLGEYLQRHQISSLQNTYSALPISTVASWIQQSPDRTLSIIQEMASGASHPKLNATVDLDLSPPVLRFHAHERRAGAGGVTGGMGTAASAEEEYLAKMVVEQTQRVERVAQFVALANSKITSTREWEEVVKRRRDNIKPTFMVQGQRLGEEDEDLMQEG